MTISHATNRRSVTPDRQLLIERHRQLDRTLSSGGIDATQLADATRQLVRGITGAAQKR
ncbi:MAG: hypothetical protein ACXU9C_24325 [Xanthobacteraceae bacterium]